jgi:hypothetical protein
MRSYWIAGVALLAACAPSFAAGSGPDVSRQTSVASSDEVNVEEPPLLLSGRLGKIGYRPLATDVWRLATDDRSLLVRTCGLETLRTPELGPLAARPLRFPSLGGPAPAVTSPDTLPALRDEARQDYQEDTLRLLRSHW